MRTQEKSRPIIHTTHTHTLTNHPHHHHSPRLFFLNPNLIEICEFPVSNKYKEFKEHTFFGIEKKFEFKLECQFNFLNIQVRKLSAFNVQVCLKPSKMDDLVELCFHCLTFGQILNNAPQLTTSQRHIRKSRTPPRSNLTRKSDCILSLPSNPQSMPSEQQKF